MKKYNNKLDKEILKILKLQKNGLNRFEICEKLGLKKYIYYATIIMKSGIYYQERILHFKRTTFYEHLEHLLNLNIIEKYRLIDNIGKPKVYWKIKK